MPVGFLKQLLPDASQRALQRARPLVAQINALEPEMQASSDDALRGQTAKLRDRLRAGAALDDLLPEAFASVREAVRRHTGERQFDVQLIGGMVLHWGDIAEMRTGEGKTSVATLAAYLNALAGQGVHIVTVNDYLAQRDATWYGKALVDRLGLTVGVIQHDLPADQRRAAYAADLTYGTNNELGFDYLRDNMVHDLAERVQRGLHFGIVDEVDNILIDEARTPLIISGAAEESPQLYYEFARLVKRLASDTDYKIDHKAKSVSLTEEGVAKVEGLLKVENLYGEGTFGLVHYLEQALRAEVLYRRRTEYVLFRDGHVVDHTDPRAEVVIVDEFTGRLMHGRRYSEGLHQAIEAKENVTVQRESQTLATITFQNYFRSYAKLAGMTGTAKTEEREFQTIYNLDVVVIPTHQPMIRKDAPDLVYRSPRGRDAAVIESIEQRHRAGQPILVGTTSIEKSEQLSQLLRRRSVPHTVLNAKFHAQEAQIVADAGRKRAVTIATNMAGRGTDIILGGRPGNRTMEEWRQQHAEVVALGGLHVVGTERHEARRIDNQLRGRSGRQGDPGSSQFYLSLQDELMRRFGSERIQGLMQRLGIEEHQPIESGLVSKAIESAQSKVEAHNYEIRKYVLEFDNVVNQQRGVIYDQRERILRVDDVEGLFRDMMTRQIEDLVNAHGLTPQSETPELTVLLESYAGIVGEGDAPAVNALAGLKADDVADLLVVHAEVRFERKVAEFTPDLARRALRWLMLQTTDYLWVQHLTAIEDMRQGIGLRAYGQQDPLVAFKREGYELFQRLIQTIQSDIVKRFFRMQIQPAVPVATMLSRHRAESDGRTPARAARTARAGRDGSTGAAATTAGAAAARAPVRAKVKIGRNEPCYCGSGKKYKHCHGC
ncbi:MAG: preprotein translocase subunit SecA [Actinobacteria bacterium]|nr:preprotein translocase subunit SecA [Actinomycetota bacterium]